MSSLPFRTDIEGLRAIAVLLVLAFHAGLPVPGGFVGVDVFFVLSGFLITGLLLREAEATGTISLVDFYARRARRLLPAASVVLLVTTVLLWVFAPRTERALLGLDVSAAAAYAVNWRFAARSVDYLAEDVGRSPVLHFWSLSVEEQFYMVWPLLIVGALLIAARARRAQRSTVATALALVFVPTLVWSILRSADSPSEAFFSTTTRLWELSIGALVALAAPWLARLPKGHIATATGLACILASAACFGPETTWPSYWAGVPTIGAALTVIGGGSANGGTLSRLVGSKPMVWIGRLSYSIYLWHWPLLVVGQDWLHLKGPAWGTALALGSVLPAWLSYKFVETPIRFSKWLNANPGLTLSMGANLSLLAVAVGALPSLLDAGGASVAPIAEIRLDTKAGMVRAKPANIGAGALGAEPKKSSAGAPRSKYGAMSPFPMNATKDVPRAYALGCQLKAPGVELRWCELGARGGNKKAVVVGDSKILQYFEAIDEAGKALGWSVQSVTKSSCPFADALVTRGGAVYRECQAVNDKIMRAFAADPPDIVITSQVSGTGLPLTGGTTRTVDAMVDGLASRWQQLRSMGIEVLVVLDNPHPAESKRIYECVLEHPDNAKQCSFERKRGVQHSAAPTQLLAAKRVPEVHLVDLTDYVCPASRCAPVIGDILVYRQGSHITNTYARTMAPVLTQKFAAALAGR